MPGFREGTYRDLDVPATLDYMGRRYVAPIRQRADISRSVLADGASGFGWLSFAYLLSGGRRAILIDRDELRLKAAEEIAKILGLRDRCEFVCELLQSTSLAEDSVDFFACIETLEHVGRPHIRASVKSITRAARSIVIVTTPNCIFPVISHDTRLPFAHWLPHRLRHCYAVLCGRAALETGNDFLGPWDLAPLKPKFRPDSAFHTFSTHAEYLSFHPHYTPYGTVASARLKTAPSFWRRNFVRLLGTLLRKRAYLLSANLASVWIRDPRRTG
ncbi:MAG: class I SAM-dependent methyltransferase [Planctomycetota bacterium]